MISKADFITIVTAIPQFVVQNNQNLNQHILLVGEGEEKSRLIQHHESRIKYTGVCLCLKHNCTILCESGFNEQRTG